MNFVTLDEAKRHLRIHPTNTIHDIDVLTKIYAASEIIFSLMNPQEIPDAWVVANTSPQILNVPYKVKAMTLLVLGELFLNREGGAANIISGTVMDLLHATFRDPPMA